MKKIAVLGSSSGNLLEALYNRLNSVDVTLECLCDDEKSDFFSKAKSLKISCKYLPWEKNFEYFSSHDFDLIVLCDYKKELQSDVLELGKFINIHPSLLPSFKGNDALYRAFNSGVKVSGVTVHWVRENLDSKNIIAQYPVLIGNLMHFDEFEKETNELEKMLYPLVIDKILKDEVFDYTDLISVNKCSGSCSNCQS